MPSIECRSSIRAASGDCNLALDVRHHLVAGESCDPTYTPDKTTLPQDVDVLLTSNLIIKLSGVVDGLEIPNREINASALAQHLVDYLHLNANKLGLNTISKLQDDEDESVKLVLTPSRQPSANPKLLPTHVLLVAIDLRYSWKTSDSSHSKLDDAHPFATRLSRSSRSLLDNVIGRFATWQLVHRYPLIFGPWCQQLDKEASYFSVIASSILRVMNRSRNARFSVRCQRLIKILCRRRLAIFSDASMSLSTYLGVDMNEYDIYKYRAQVTDEDALKFALERVYRDGLPQLLFKGLPGTSNGRNTEGRFTSRDKRTSSPDKCVGHEKFFWDGTSIEVPMLTYSPSPSNHSFQDIQSDSERDYFPDVIDPSDKGETDCDIDELLPWEYHNNLEEHQFEPRHAITNIPVPTNTLYGMNVNGMFPIVVDDDDDHLTIDSEEFDCKPGSPQSLLRDDQSSCKSGSATQSSQGVGLLEPGRISWAAKASTSSPLHSPSNTGQLSRKAAGSNIYLDYNECKQRQPFAFEDGNCEYHPQKAPDRAPPPPLRAPFDGDDDLNIDTKGVDILSQMETNAGNGGVLVAMSTRPSFSETSYSHHSPTLAVTCPPQSNCPCQLRTFQEEFVDSEEELCRQGLEGGSTFNNYGEEDLAVLDF